MLGSKVARAQGAQLPSGEGELQSLDLAGDKSGHLYIGLLGLTALRPVVEEMLAVRLNEAADDGRKIGARRFGTGTGQPCVESDLDRVTQRLKVHRQYPVTNGKQPGRVGQAKYLAIRPPTLSPAATPSRLMANSMRASTQR